MFLTTNRPEDFDPAFLSRIHITIDFPQLDPQRRTRIWRNLASQMNKDESLNDAGFEELGRDFAFNGREIKNVLRTAWSLAKDESEVSGKDPTLGLEHLKTVASIGTRSGHNAM